MNNKVVIVSILIAVVLVSGCINSEIGNLNKIINDLSNDIVNGDTNYNNAVNSLNSKDYTNAESSIFNASTSYTNSFNKVSEAIKDAEGLNNTLYLNYLNIVKEEIQLKLNATNQLQLAVQSYKNGAAESGNTYSDKASAAMTQALIKQKERAEIAKNNPDKFN
ncbi:MAG: hypothetical protein ACRC1M_04015 [Methanobacteriaceae archaeon]